MCLCSGKPQLPIFSYQSLGLGAIVYPVSLSLYKAKELWFFLVYSAFYLFLGQSDDYQAPYMQNEKLEVNFFSLKDTNYKN